MNKVVLLGVEVDRGKCVTVCPVDALAYGCGFGGSDAVPGGVQWEKQQQQGTKQSGRGGCHVSGADGTGESDFCKEQEVVGKPIVGSITSDEQKKAPNDIIEQAMKKSEESKGGAFAPANAPPSLYRKFFVFGLGGRPHVVSGMFHSHPHGICRFVSAGNRQNESYYITGILPCQHLILPGIINQQPNAVI